LFDASPALAALEKQSGLLYDEDKYNRGSELLQVRPPRQQPPMRPLRFHSARLGLIDGARLWDHTDK
jgi:hypothetical protein